MIPPPKSPMRRAGTYFRFFPRIPRMYVIQAFVPGRGLRDELLDPLDFRREPFFVLFRAGPRLRRRGEDLRERMPRPAAVAWAAVWRSPPGRKLRLPMFGIPHCDWPLRIASTLAAWPFGTNCAFAWRRASRMDTQYSHSQLAASERGPSIAAMRQFSQPNCRAVISSLCCTCATSTSSSRCCRSA